MSATRRTAPRPATPGTPDTRRRGWRDAGPRRVLAGAAFAAAAGVALSVQACADATRPAGGPTVPTEPRATDAHAASRALTDEGLIGRGLTDPAAGGAAWIGRAHHDGLRAVFARTRAAAPTARTADARCTALLDATTRHAADLAAGGAEYVPAAVRTLLAEPSPALGKYACGSTRVAEGGLAAGLRQLVQEGRLVAGPDAQALIEAVDQEIAAQPDARALDRALTPLEQAAAHLADPSERQLVWSTTATTRSSAYDAEAHCTHAGCVPYGAPPPPPGAYDFGARGATERRAGVIKAVVVADTWGCIAGAVRGWAGGPTGVGGGCLVGGLIASGAVIWQYALQ
jgi:hypothetical protein